MADPDLEFYETFSPSTAEIDFLTEKINEESRVQSISSDAYPFGIFLRAKRNGNHAAASHSQTASAEGNEGEIVGGCNGSIVFGSIYTDQLWIDPKYRGRGLGKMLMTKVHELGKRQRCSFATVGTMDFQHAQKFYERLGYIKEFERLGYSDGGRLIYLRKDL